MSRRKAIALAEERATEPGQTHPVIIPKRYAKDTPKTIKPDKPAGKSKADK